MDDEPDSALDQASEEGDLETVQSLVNGPSRPSAQDLRIALNIAAACGHSAVVNFLLDQGAEITKATGAAAVDGHSPAVFQALLDRGWDINSKSRTGAPVLKNLVKDEAMVRWFLDHGADPNIPGDRDEYPLNTAAYGCTTTAVVALLLERGARIEKSDALHAATRGKWGIPMMAFLLDHGFPIDALEHQHNPPYFESMKDFGFGTALHTAVKAGSEDRARFLLERGARRDIQNSTGFTPEEWAEAFDEEACRGLLRNWTSNPT